MKMVADVASLPEPQQGGSGAGTGRAQFPTFHAFGDRSPRDLRKSYASLIHG
jgi:hypothetical protein